MFVGHPTPYVDDNNPPTLSDNDETIDYDAYGNMIYGKRILHTDVARMVKRYDWVSNTVYAKFTHDADDIFSTNFYTVVDDGSQYSVFKCLDNNNGSSSTTQPKLFSNIT